MNDLIPLVVANLKANKTWNEMCAWLNEIGPKCSSFTGTVVVCPSDPFLSSASEIIKRGGWVLKLGNQDISQFEQGAYTGEVAASQISDLVQYSIIGHSERRQNFKEDEEILKVKVTNIKKAQIEPIFCIQSEDDLIPAGVKIVAYEPVFAIGTGNPDTPQNVQNIATQIKGKGQFTVIYGGSVAPENVKSYLRKNLIDGVLVGATNSLNPEKFNQVLESATF